jgi:G3E family GTPase
LGQPATAETATAARLFNNTGASRLGRRIVGAKLIIVGGFLGSGKTTLLWEAAQRLSAQGYSVGLITNDQAPDLVDTALLSHSRLGVREVAGSCFCCNFDGLAAAVRSLIKDKADIIIAEPVGSCTDLAATILRPMKHKHPELELAPLTVLAAPERVREVLSQADSLMHASALYILRLQMEEADCILLNKIDALGAAERLEMSGLLRAAFRESTMSEISARSGEGVDAWLDFILGSGEAGMHIVDVDYDRYAEGEAVLGWLNAVIDLQSRQSFSEFTTPTLELLEHLHKALRQRNAEIGHLKAMLESGAEARDASITRLGGSITGRDHSPLAATTARLILNIRAQTPPAILEALTREALDRLSDETMVASIRTLRCLMPGRPQPTYRYTQPV